MRTTFTYKNENRNTLTIVEGGKSRHVLISVGRSAKDGVVERSCTVAIPKTYLPVLRKVLSDIEKGD